MKVKLRTRLSGPAGSHEPGAVADLDRSQAYDLIERGFAEQIEDATRPPRETADSAANRRKSRRG